MTPEDRKIINKHMTRLARNGHPESWHELYVCLRPFGLSIAWQQIRDPDVVEDVVQSSFLRLRKVCHRYHKEADAFSFYKSILTNVIREHHAKRKRDGAISLFPDMSGIAEELLAEQRFKDLTGPEYDAHGSHFWEEFEKKIQGLPSSMREAIRGRLILNMTSTEVAKEGNCSAATIRKRLERALIKLRFQLKRFRLRSENDLTEH